MSFSEIVIESPPGTVAVTIALPVGPLEGALDTDTGTVVLDAAAGFRVTEGGAAFFDPQGLSGGAPAQLAISESGIVTLTVAGSPSGDMLERPEGTAPPVVQRSGRDESIELAAQGEAAPVAKAPPGVAAHRERQERDARPGTAAGIEQAAGRDQSIELPPAGEATSIEQAAGRDETSAALPDEGTASPIAPRAGSLSRWARDQLRKRNP